MSSASRSVFAAASMGLLGGVVLSLFATAVLIAKGFPEELPIPQIYAMYLGGGAAAGAIIGLLRPWLKTRHRASAASAVAMLPIIIGFGVLVAGPIRSWGETQVKAVILLAIFFGFAVGRITWEQLNFDRRK